MITVQSTFHLRQESKAEALRLMKNMVQLSRQEPGCLSYEYFEGITEPTRVILLQEWESPEYLEEHFQTEHMESFLNDLGKHLTRPVTTRSYLSHEDPARKPLTAAPPKPEQTIH